jgi:hypothetical protein
MRGALHQLGRMLALLATFIHVHALTLMGWEYYGEVYVKSIRAASNVIFVLEVPEVSC